jgi:hypothetical protein
MTSANLPFLLPTFLLVKLKAAEPTKTEKKKKIQK